MSVKCRLCDGETNCPDSICRVCKLFRKEEVAVFSVTPVEAGIQKKLDARLQSSGMIKRKTNGGEKMGDKYKSHRKCKVEGCFKYAVKEGMCTKCFNKEHGIEKHVGRKRIGAGFKPAPTSVSKICIDCKNEYKPTSNVQKRCQECGMKWKAEKNNKRKNKSQVSHGAPPIKKAKAFGDNIGPKGGRASEPEIKKPTSVIPVEAGIQNARTAALAQLLYASDLLDGQLNNAIENGIIDTKTILDIRFRLGAVLRGNVGIPPAEMRA